MALALALSFGAAKMEVKIAWEALTHYNSEVMNHQIIREIRLPRILATAIVGASLSAAGAIMQGITRNPLADAGLLGINAGASFMLAVGLAFLPQLSYSQMMLISFIGAGLGIAITYGTAMANRRSLSPERLVMVGVAVTFLFTALSQFLAISKNIGQDLVYWSVGGTAGVGWQEIKSLLPWFIGAVFLTIYLSPAITVLSLGEDVAKGLGQQTMRIKTLAMIAVLLLAGLAVSLVGSIGFVGLIIPHLIRHFVGVDYRYVLPCSLLYGAFFMVFADLIGRVINAPYETPLGIIFALIGVPFFLYISKKEGVSF